MRKPLPNALDIDFRGRLTEEVTPHAGVALLWAGALHKRWQRQREGMS